MCGGVCLGVCVCARVQTRVSGPVMAGLGLTQLHKRHETETGGWGEATSRG